MPSHKIAKISSDMARAISEIIFNETRDELLKRHIEFIKRIGYF